MFSVVYMYLDHLKFCVECNEPTSCLVQPIGSHCCEVTYFGCFGFRGELGFLNCDDVVVRLPRLMEGNGVTPIFRSLQNCQFHHRRLE